jgi:pyridoxamine 5'-phosphate oxidase
VLLKRIDKRGFAFYTNTESRKARELAENSEAALALYWLDLGRQVRATGPVRQLPREDVEAYFATRPVESRLGAWASRQSEPLSSRAELEERYAELAARFADDDVPLPSFWGGYELRPRELELWEHRESRLHDRVQYRLEPDGSWSSRILAP